MNLEEKIEKKKSGTVTQEFNTRLHMLTIYTPSVKASKLLIHH